MSFCVVVVGGGSCDKLDLHGVLACCRVCDAAVATHPAVCDAAVATHPAELSTEK